MIKKILILGIILTYGCEKQEDLPTNTDMQTVEDNLQTVKHPSLNGFIDSYVAPPLPDCIAGEEDSRSDNNKSCINFDLNFYKKANSGAAIAQAISSSRNRKAAFEKYFAPLAVYVQQKTGYPASVLLTQWADETGWGVSKQVRVNNNIGGHSCFRYDSGYQYPPAKRQPGPSYINPPINVKCTYKRPAAEGAYYMSFDNILEASLAQVYNIIHNPTTARSYANVRREAKRAIDEKRKMNPEKLIEGLGAYAAFPPEYRLRLIKRMKNEGYQKYDYKKVCN
jgi:uncharacterized FlgJ-related protein